MERCSEHKIPSLLVEIGLPMSVCSSPGAALCNGHT
jgi:hypothetical protein